jgi:hypothetical protein
MKIRFLLEPRRKTSLQRVAVWQRGGGWSLLVSGFCVYSIKFFFLEEGWRDCLRDSSLVCLWHFFFLLLFSADDSARLFTQAQREREP